MWSDIFLFLVTAHYANWILTDRFVKLRWQAAHVYSMESTTCDVSPNFLLLSLVALRRPRSSGLCEAEHKTKQLHYRHVQPQCSAKVIILNVEDLALLWSPIVIPLFRHFMTTPKEAGWDHTANKLASTPLLLLHRSLSAQASSLFH